MNETAAVLSGNTFLTSLFTDHCTFADEIDKFFFLKSLKRILQSSCCSGISFVLTDEILHLILFSQTDGICPDEILLTGFYQDFYPYYKDRHPKQILKDVCADAVRLEGGEQLLEKTVSLHLAPKRQGFVNWAADYWWCSSQTYLGRYFWDFLNPDLLLSLIDKDFQRARRELGRYSRSAYVREFGTKYGYNR